MLAAPQEGKLFGTIHPAQDAEAGDVTASGRCTGGAEPDDPTRPGGPGRLLLTFAAPASAFDMKRANSLSVDTLGAAAVEPSR